MTALEPSWTPLYRNLTLLLFRCTLGEIDQALDEKTPWSEIRAEPLAHIRN